jgi:ribosomal-protein-alanine N-acetyltransferase
MVTLARVSPAAGECLRAGRRPPGLSVPDDYPTEFSAGIGEAALKGQELGPFFVRRVADGLVVGEIGGAVVEPRTAEIGYAIVDSCAGRGYASAAVRELTALARETAGVERLVAHAPLERPASSRVLEKAGFSPAGERDDEHEGDVVRVRRWELDLRPTRRAAAT